MGVIEIFIEVGIWVSLAAIPVLVCGIVSCFTKKSWFWFIGWPLSLLIFILGIKSVFLYQLKQSIALAIMFLIFFYLLYALCIVLISVGCGLNIKGTAIVLLPSRFLKPFQREVLLDKKDIWKVFLYVLFRVAFLHGLIIFIYGLFMPEVSELVKVHALEKSPLTGNFFEYDYWTVHYLPNPYGIKGIIIGIVAFILCRLTTSWRPNKLNHLGGKNMAYINCPKCGKEVSDSAAICNHCGFSLSSLNTEGEVTVKISSRLQGRCKVYDMNTKEVLWEGTTGENAVFSIKKPTRIGVAWGVNVDKMYNIIKATQATVIAGEKWEMTMEVTSAIRGMEFKLRKIGSINK